ncbi:MAG: hypothetical protein ACLQO7_04845 [Candidatus Bathyarchaeia archaeon]
MAEKALDNHQYKRLEVAFSFSPKEFHPWFPEPQQTLTRSQHVVTPFFLGICIGDVYYFQFWRF